MTKSARQHRDHGRTSAATVPAPHISSANTIAATSTSDDRRELDGVADPADRNVTPTPRPTAVPDYDVGALASASFRSMGPAQIPLDLTVPVRKEASADGVPLRAAFLLSHVDNRTSIAELASSAQIPIADAIDCFLLLAELGIVELRGLMQSPAGGPAGDRRPPTGTPKSGLRTKR